MRDAWGPKPGVDNVFISARGRQLNVETVGNIVKETAEKAGLRKEVWTHIFRHSRITRLLENKRMSIQDVGKLVGHVNPATTQRYYHPEDEVLRESYDRATQEPKRRGRNGNKRSGTE